VRRLTVVVAALVSAFVMAEKPRHARLHVVLPQTGGPS
jgi:hypothetical protein